MHIFKRHMGLTKRGSSDNEPLTVSNVSVNQTDNFTLRETSKFATLIIPTAQILQTKVSDETTGSAFCVIQLGQFKYTAQYCYTVFPHKDSLQCKTSKPGLFYRPAQTANNSCSRSTGWMLCSPSKRQITKCIGPWRTHCHAQVSVLLMNTVKLKW